MKSSVVVAVIGGVRRGNPSICENALKHVRTQQTSLIDPQNAKGMDFVANPGFGFVVLCGPQRSPRSRKKRSLGSASPTRSYSNKNIYICDNNGGLRRKRD